LGGGRHYWTSTLSQGRKSSTELHGNLGIYMDSMRRKENLEDLQGGRDKDAHERRHGERKREQEEAKTRTYMTR